MKTALSVWVLIAFVCVEHTFINKNDKKLFSKIRSTKLKYYKVVKRISTNFQLFSTSSAIQTTASQNYVLTHAVLVQKVQKSQWTTQHS